ncbi:hypothetical protein KO500_11325 [Cellulophaga baltica]|uniref:hypothetical protein n=1 Tax=Cellulophaga TaxID=104264 RepID=UPI001C066390|nr:MULTISPECIES: hypothetical protein [Cellulophaga]MBU2997029.1 hypothetical protein [Cellulophaga baltica]MDO6768427.1 hypothetical protein [Cellulophaga sp. 1_MG-2023]
MLFNVSYNNKQITTKIDTEVGKPFTLKERWNMNGIGSPKLFIINTSVTINNLLILDNNTNTCNIELRPKGIIIRFRSLLETYALVIPFYKLVIYKGDFAAYTVFRDHNFIKIKADTKAIQKYFKKILAYKADNSPTSLTDL